MVPHTLHLLIVRVLNAKLDSKTAGGRKAQTFGYTLPGFLHGK